MTHELESGPSTLCPSCGRHVQIADDDARPRCPLCGHRWKRACADGHERREERVSAPGSTYRMGAMLYVAGASLAFCGLPMLGDTPGWPLRGWVGGLGAILVGWSPRGGVRRSLGLCLLFLSGMFFGKHLFVFFFGVGLMIAGIAVVNQRPARPVAIPVGDNHDGTPGAGPNEELEPHPARGEPW